MPQDEKLTRDDFVLYLEGLSKKEIGDEFEIVIPPKATVEDMVDLVWLTYQAEREQLIGGEEEDEPGDGKADNGQAETCSGGAPGERRGSTGGAPIQGKTGTALFSQDALAALPKFLEEAGKPLLSSELQKLFVERRLCTASAKRRVVAASFKANEELVERRHSSYKLEGDVGGKGRGEYVYSLRTLLK